MNLSDEQARFLSLFEQVKSGALTPEQAAESAREMAEDLTNMMGLVKMQEACLDLHRKIRCGAPEVVFGQGKTVGQILEIGKKLLEHAACVLMTRLEEEQICAVRTEWPQARVDELAKTAILGKVPHPASGHTVLILTAGTSDLPVAREAAESLLALGFCHEIIADVGIAGLHRLLAHADKITAADAIIVIAGMEGALPSVVGGLVRKPVIAVPTSIGYGASLGGLSAMLGMLNSCASGVTLVNIDNGFGAGYAAARILWGYVPESGAMTEKRHSDTALYTEERR